MKRNAARWMAPALALLLCCGVAFAARPSWVKVTGTTWRIPLTVTVDLGGELGDFSWDGVEGVFTFGPKGKVGKSKFTWTSGEDGFDASVTGSFKPEKNKVKLTVSSSQWNALIKAAIRAAAEEKGADLSDLSVKFKRMTLLGCQTSRDDQGELLEFQMQGQIQYSLKIEGEKFSGTGSFTVEGTGRR